MPRRVQVKSRLLTSLILAATALSALTAATPAGARSLGDLVAPTRVCKHQRDAGLPSAVQERSMRCMINFARRKTDRHRLSASVDLGKSSGRKSSDIIRCNSFSHSACGRDFTYWMRRTGFITQCWSAGENIAWGSNSYGSVRSIMKAWVHSPEHLQNILNGSFKQFGVGLDVGTLVRYRNAHVWTTHFGTRC